MPALGLLCLRQKIIPLNVEVFDLLKEPFSFLRQLLTAAFREVGETCSFVLNVGKSFIGIGNFFGNRCFFLF